ncbi:hypothetical protein FRB99_003212 [Tulasnella sp. 403]|nr:hypothetical protein FRB99_003212 [Tulasnella sp. 403]
MFSKVVSLSVALALFGSAVNAATCAPGFHVVSGGPNAHCEPCPAGSFSSIAVVSNKPTKCTLCPGGTWSPTVGASSQAACQLCPAGAMCPNGSSSPELCPPGKFAAETGSDQCEKCPAGEFNSVSGAKKCCECCGGTFAPGPGNTACKACPANKPFSAPGSINAGECQKADNHAPNTYNNPTCSMSGAICPNPATSGPQGSAINRKKRDITCTRGHKLCPHWAGRGGFECVNVQSDAESCGGCIDVDAKGNADKGRDCTALPGVNVVYCVDGGCQIESCRKGFTLSADAKSCEQDSVLNVQSVKARSARLSARHGSL